MQAKNHLDIGISGANIEVIVANDVGITLS
jgi:hypothetical protein